MEFPWGICLCSSKNLQTENSHRNYAQIQCILHRTRTFTGCSGATLHNNKLCRGRTALQITNRKFKSWFVDCFLLCWWNASGELIFKHFYLYLFHQMLISSLSAWAERCKILGLPPVLPDKYSCNNNNFIDHWLLLANVVIKLHVIS